MNPAKDLFRTAAPAGSRAERLQSVIEDCMRRRAGGEALADEQVLGENRDLEPDLSDALRKLAVISGAIRRAHAPSGDPQIRELRDAPAAVIPGYDIAEEIHRGGQGVVYRAFQRTTRRVVAIKVMRDGPFAGAADRQRFEREVLILGAIKHPNIVAIYDSGVSGGSHYFVMDYVAGLPLDRWLSESRWLERRGAGRSAREGLRHTLQLFLKVCQAVQAAHLRGIIHRDLKPGNIRVDDRGEPYVLDFGLAKMDPSGSSGADVMTQTGQFVGSVPWASPEQAEGSPAMLDVRSDVYSLGVMLYQALTGRFPYDMSGSLRQVLDRIHTAEPLRPRTLRADIDDELEAILLRCLQKEPERRYQTAGELAADLKRYLAGEAIEAKRDSAAYLLRKQLRRYRAPLAIAAAFVVILAGGLVATLTFWRQALFERNAALAAREQESRQRRLAQDAGVEAEAQRSLAVSHARQARAQADIADATNRFLQEMLAAADRGSQQGRPDVPVREVLDIAAEKVEAGQVQPPLVEAAVRETVGRTYHALGLYAPAELHLRKALDLYRAELGSGHVRAAEVLRELGLVVSDRGDPPAAAALYREALALDHAAHGDRHPDTIRDRNRLAQALRLMGRFDEAAEVARKAVEDARGVLGGAGLANVIDTLALVHFDHGRFDEAEPLLREAIGLYRAEEPQGLRVAAAQTSLGMLLRNRGLPDEAEQVLRESLAVRRKLLGDDHPHLATTLSGLGNVLADRKQNAEAEACFREAVRIHQARIGSASPEHARTLNNLAGVLQAQGRMTEAEEAYRQALSIWHAVYPEGHPDAGTVVNNLATLAGARGDFSSARELTRQALAIRRKLLEPGHPLIAATLHNLAYCHAQLGEAEAAIDLYHESIDMRRASLGPNHPGLAGSLVNLADLLRHSGRAAEAVPLLHEAVGIRRVAGPSAEPALASALALLGQTHLVLEDFTAAEAPLRECLLIRERRAAAGDESLCHAMSLLGLALAGQGRYAEAEPLLLGSVEEFPVNPGRSADRAVLIRRVIQLYEAWETSIPGQGKAAQAAAWKARLDESVETDKPPPAEPPPTGP